ncbi:hypothetical protein FRC19_001715, partial [Serendipita sp. 401]
MKTPEVHSRHPSRFGITAVFDHDILHEDGITVPQGSFIIGAPGIHSSLVTTPQWGRRRPEISRNNHESEVVRMQGTIRYLVHVDLPVIVRTWVQLSRIFVSVGLLTWKSDHRY